MKQKKAGKHLFITDKTQKFQQLTGIITILRQNQYKTSSK